MRLPHPRDLQEYVRRIPTTDLYILNPLRHLARLPEGAGLPRIKHLFGNVYSVGRTGIISRYATLDELRRLERGGIRKIVYAVDDDFEAAAADPQLPAPYRAKLAAFAAGPWPFLKAAADQVVVSSPPIAAIYGAKARLLHPVWHRPPAGLKHFGRAGRIEIVHLGTASHGSDFAPLAPVLAGFLTAHPQARLTLFSAAGLPDPLEGHAQVRVRRPKAWWRYKLALPRMRFHLAIYPLQENAFNAARSANKLFEQALVGASPSMSPNAALLEVAGPELSGIFVDGGPEAWRTRLEADIGNLRASRRRAEAVRARILAFDPAGAAARQWRGILAAEF